MKKPFSKFVSILFVSFLISACEQTGKSSFTNDSLESKSEYNSTEVSSNTNINQSKSTSSENPISSATPISITPPPSSVDHNPNNCSNHVLSETILKKIDKK